MRLCRILPHYCSIFTTANFKNQQLRSTFLWHNSLCNSLYVTDQSKHWFYNMRNIHVVGSNIRFPSTSKSVQTNWSLVNLCDAVGPVACHSIVTVPPAATVTPLLIKCAVQIPRTSVNVCEGQGVRWSWVLKKMYIHYNNLFHYVSYRLPPLSLLEGIIEEKNWYHTMWYILDAVLTVNDFFLA